jgi:hypothetical protein
MAQLFSNIEEFRASGGAVDNDEAMLESIEADIDAAINEHLRPWLGDDLTDSMIDAYPDAVAPLSILTTKVQVALAPLSLFHAAKTKNIRFNTAGLVRPENVPFRYQENDYKEEMLVRGYESIELLLKYLDKNAASFTNWDKKNKHRSLFLRYASDFRDASSHRLSRWTFENLRAIIDDVEFYAIEKLLPKQFFNRLKTGMGLTDKEKEVVRLIHKVIANFTIEEAVRRNRVQINGGNIFNVSETSEQASQTRRTADPLSIERTATYQNLAADRNVARLRAFIEANKDGLGLCFHVSVNGLNADTDAWGYVPPPKTDIEIQTAYEVIELMKQRRVVSL